MSSDPCMPAGCNCGPNSPLVRALSCHCLRRGTAVIASQLPLPRWYSAAVQDCKWRYIKWASFIYLRWYMPGAKKSNRQKSFAVFSATIWNFCVKFYMFTWLSYLHLTAKWHLIIFKYDKVIDILAWLLSDFRALKNVCAETQQNSVTETTQ